MHLHFKAECIYIWSIQRFQPLFVYHTFKANLLPLNLQCYAYILYYLYMYTCRIKMCDEGTLQKNWACVAGCFVFAENRESIECCFPTFLSSPINFTNAFSVIHPLILITELFSIKLNTKWHLSLHFILVASG